MEFYFYVILIFAIVLKLAVYLCWYHVRRSSSSHEVRIIMPDGTTRCAVISARGRQQHGQQSHDARNVPEERQNFPQADTLVPYENQGMVECAVQPRYTDNLSPVGQGTHLTHPYGQEHWKLPKYEEVHVDGMPPPYSTIQPEVASAVQPSESFVPSQNPAQPPTYHSHTVVTVPAHLSQAPYQPPPYAPPVVSAIPETQPDGMIVLSAPPSSIHQN